MKTRRNENKKKNNKGFSLVELIVVIAIMAVLVAVLAPQFTKYVDRSRMSNDATTVAGIVSAVQTGVADLTDYKIDDATYMINIAAGGTTVHTVSGGTESSALASVASATVKGNIVDAIEDSCGDLGNLKETSKGFATVIKVQVEVTDGVPEVTYFGDFKDYIES